MDAIVQTGPKLNGITREWKLQIQKTKYYSIVYNEYFFFKTNFQIGPQILPFSERIGSIEIGTTDWESQSNYNTIHKGTIVGWGFVSHLLELKNLSM